ncbi:hypothetical protein DVH24_012102 [Malus domestica]|uniref:peroxidase n=1 Tax=Malus domestica TaxID=3750 RepID=A0A498HLN1_MALDO|nr:hypothetical protein DVH24_012102 [Malus domestica]
MLFANSHKCFHLDPFLGQSCLRFSCWPALWYFSCSIVLLHTGFHLAMGDMNFIHFMGFIFLSVLISSETCLASVRNFGAINSSFQWAQMNWIDNNGLFLLSNKSEFGFGFQTTPNDVTLFLLVVVHMDSSTVVWTANRGSPVSNSDKIVFDAKSGVSLQKGGRVVWSADTGGKSVSTVELQDSGNLVLNGDDKGVVWQSFSHPTDTLLWNQEFSEGMKLVSNPSSNNLSYILQIKSGDLVLSAGFQTPQPYWSMAKESRKTINMDGGVVTSATISENSWKFFDRSKALLWQFIFSSNIDANATWIAVLGSDGFISFDNLQNGGSSGPSETKIPSDSCSTPEPCDSYFECYSNNKCQCPSGLSSRTNCKAGVVSSCNPSEGSTELVNAGDGLYYFALGYIPPSSKTDLNGCQTSCLGNCSCVAMFFQNSTRNCFLFDRLGSFQNSDKGSGFVSYIKVLRDGSSGKSGNSKKHFPYVVIIAISTMLEEGKMRDILDTMLGKDEADERVHTAIMVALWCIQEDMSVRPSMTKVVQMLEGLYPVPQPPTSNSMGSRLYSNFFKSASDEGTSSGPSDCNSDAYLSADAVLFLHKHLILKCPQTPFSLSHPSVRNGANYLHRRPPLLLNPVHLYPLLLHHIPVQLQLSGQIPLNGQFSRQSSSRRQSRHFRRGLVLTLTATLPWLLPFSECTAAKAAESDGSEYELMKEEIRKVVTKGKAAGVLRLVFHDAGTYQIDDNSGGMDGSIVYELDRPENKVSWADMIAVAGAEAVSICGGPTIQVPLGRLDSKEPDPEGKLPEETLDASGLKQSFQTKGFSTQELVALSGAHTIGNKGFGNPTVFDNTYFKILLEKPSSGSMIGLPSDRALAKDDECLSWITKYAADQNMFFKDFKTAYLKLVNSGARWKSL